MRTVHAGYVLWRALIAKVRKVATSFSTWGKGLEHLVKNSPVWNLQYFRVIRFISHICYNKCGRFAFLNTHYWRLWPCPAWYLHACIHAWCADLHPLLVVKLWIKDMIDSQIVPAVCTISSCKQSNNGPHPFIHRVQVWEVYICSCAMA